MEDGRTQLIRLARSIAWRRRLLAAGLAAAAVALAIEAASPSAPQGVDTVVAARDLDGGTQVSAADLTTVQLPAEAVPAGVVDPESAIGAVLAGPVRAGEPITDQRLVGESLLAGWGDDLVAAPVRIADAGAVTLIRPGDRVTLIAAAIDGAGARPVAADVPVLAVPDGEGAGLTEGALLLVAATPQQAADLAQAGVTARLTFTIGGPP